jgi:histidyl-tRNA synthetase
MELQNAPKITYNLCKSCDEDFSKLKNILDKNGVDYEVDTNLVRGLDYYTKTAFEFVSDEIGSQSAIAGGGRYDRLTEFLGGRSTPAVGFAIGIERLLELIKVNEENEEILYIGAMCEEAIDKVFSLVASKRKIMKVLTDYKVRGFTKHLENAKKQNCSVIVLIGDNELTNRTVWVKNTKTNEEKTISIEEF